MIYLARKRHRMSNKDVSASRMMPNHKDVDSLSSFFSASYIQFVLNISTPSLVPTQSIVLTGIALERMTVFLKKSRHPLSFIELSVTLFMQTNLRKNRMDQFKGFSLIEVLMSLMLVSTVALALMQQQWKNKELLNQIIMYSKASHYLDQVNEELALHTDRLPTIPFPYLLSIQNTRLGRRLKLDWHQGTQSIQRQLVTLR